MNRNMMIGIAVILGIVITLATGWLAPSTPNGLVGAKWYGFPMAWMYNLVTYPPATTYNYVNLVIDIVAWAILVLILEFAAMKLRKKQ